VHLWVVTSRLTTTIRWASIKSCMASWWEIWCKALGQKAFEDDKRADKVAIVRTVWILFNMITCCFIIASGMVNLGWI